MPHFPPWEGSRNKQEADKIKAEIEARLKTVKADIERVKPKLNTYKKETLQRLIKEAEANYQATLKRNKALFEAPDRLYILTVDRAEKEIIKREKAEFEKFVKEVMEEAKKCIADAMQYSGHGGPMQQSANLCDLYSNQIEMFKAELAETLKEKAPNPQRKI
ncbi:MAG: hypothetical protein KGN36_11090 [Acidobacteriota bacterium]|nr:hypothetical protein [Acidobacteriota bacterium]